MIKELFHWEGPVFSFLDKAGQLILLSLLWFLGCIPLVTIATANCSLYYAVVKSVRRGQGNPVKEFLRSYRENLWQGILITVAAGAILALLTLNLRILQGQGNGFLTAGSVVGILVTAFILLYTGPILSRFQLKTMDIVKLSFVMSLRNIFRTIAIVLGAAVVAAVQFFFLPIPVVVILPGTICWIVSFPLEKSLRSFMPPKEENNNAWYYET